ncbi:tripartite tricarboxylate transporter substrate binding protein [Hydrogenophaga sp.]|uniref:Bug family tripartite tricarboxylate transporter substrate binding protein n=1 Tax=Hydrogenophaga sp. TaxID=1904254 RepID=UPI00261344FA|nr:tripartite tricarboxylate transporter substrate binding protein [Hydrogenophaga sp.]
MLNRRQIIAASSLTALAPLAHAQQYPVRPIKLIYNFAPGGPGDAISRYLAQQMGATLGQSVIVENRTGGGGAVGILAAARSPADGYNLLYSTVTGLVQVPLVTKDENFDPFSSLMPIMGVGVTPLAILAHPSVPADDVPSFLAWARQQPKGVDIAGAGPIIEVTTALLAREARLNLVYIGYRGAAPAVQAVLAGDVKFYFNTPSALTAEHLKAGRLKVIGVTSAEPSSLFPGGQPISRHVPGFVQEIAFAMFAPAGTPADVMARLQDALGKVLSEPGLAERFHAQGLSLKPTPAADVMQMARREDASIRRILETTPVKFGG